MSLLYRKNKKRVYFYGGILFLLLLIDNTIINLSEFSLSFEQLYETGDSVYYVAYTIYLGIILVGRQMIKEVYHKEFSKLEKALLVLLPLGLVFLGYQADHKVFELGVHLSFFGGLGYLYACVWWYIDKNKYRNAVLILLGGLSVLAILDSVFYFQSYNVNLAENIVIDSLEYRFLAFDGMKLLVIGVGFWSIRQNLLSLVGYELDKNLSTEEKIENFCVTYELTNRQKDIVTLIIEGDSNKEISEKLFITEGTVKTHIYNIFKKVEVTSRQQIIKKVLSE
jgi:DNA-binding CsgD family transcriptional regulator